MRYASERDAGESGEGFATNDPRQVIGVPVACVGIDFIPRRQRRRELESGSAKSRFRYIYACVYACVCMCMCVWHALYAATARNYVRADGTETPPSLLINHMIPERYRRQRRRRRRRRWRVFFFHVVVSPRHRFSRRVDRFPFRSAARTLICSLLGPLRHRKAPWRTRRKGRISRENPHSKKELTRLMQSGGQSLFIQATSLNISSVFENATRLFIVYPGKSGFFEEPTLGFT